MVMSAQTETYLKRQEMALLLPIVYLSYNSISGDISSGTIDIRKIMYLKGIGYGNEILN